MKKYWLLVLSTLICGALFAQTPYFQQDVHSEIHVSLDDKAHELTGSITIDYTNNAPFALDSMYFHLWPNAYSHRNTAFAKQQIQMGSDAFYFANEKDLGAIIGLEPKADDLPVTWKYLHPDSPDIAIFYLPKPLAPGKTVTIQTPFVVKIPASFSRLGHVGQSYQITQWYPKPAVLDHKGWHPMPYLDLGEFYGEFGSFDVSISLPQNYIVAATGSLQTESEKKILTEKALILGRSTNKKFENDTAFPPSSDQLKTIRYTAQNVHDFAWFADKRFHVMKDTVQVVKDNQQLQSIDTWAFFTNEQADLWVDATDYLKEVIRHYSIEVGAYPYPQVTAVHSALSAGAGMEYPMITVIGNSENRAMLDLVIAHEVGHNWFYGILASNERDHAWMDEGLNTFYEVRYTGKKYDNIIESFGASKNLARDIGAYGMNHFAYLLEARERTDMAPETHADKFNTKNYQLGAYSKPSIALQHLEAYVGPNEFDRIMQLYYSTWAFKHPYPEDFRNLWTQESGKELNWFFDGLLGSTKKMDYSIEQVHVKEDVIDLRITNTGELDAPLLLGGFYEDSLMHIAGFDGFVGTKTIQFKKGEYDELMIDPNRRTIDLNPANNSTASRPLRIRFFGVTGSPDEKHINMFPIYAYNAYDRSMIGMHIYSDQFPAQKVSYSLSPLYSLFSGTLVGSGQVAFSFFPKGNIRKFQFAIDGQRFSEFYNVKHDNHQMYSRLSPSFIFNFKPKDNINNKKRTLRLTYDLVQTEQSIFGPTGNLKGTENRINNYARTDWMSGSGNALYARRWNVGLEYGQYNHFDISTASFLKGTTSLFQQFAYQQNRTVGVRLFAGYFLMNDARDKTSYNNRIVDGSFSIFGHGRDDYAFRNLIMGRSEQTGILSQETQLSDGMFKLPVLNGQLGRSNDWMAGINVESDFPVKVPTAFRLKAYMDMAMYSTPTGSDSYELVYSGGLKVGVLNDFLSVYFPIVNSQNLNNLLQERSFIQRITFSVQLEKMNVHGMTKGLF